MYCKRCGAFVPDGDRFCQECGAQIGDASRPAGTGSVQPPVQNAQRSVQTAPAARNNYNIDWNTMQPRKKRAPASALIVGLGLLLAASLLIVSAMAFLSPGGLGYIEGGASADSTEGPRATARPAATAVPTAEPTAEPETGVGELPASIAAAVNKNAASKDYAGSFTGTMTLETYNLDRLIEVTGSTELAGYAAVNGSSYNVKAEYSGKRLKVTSVDFPLAGSSGTVLDIRTKNAPDNGGCISEQTHSNKGFEVKNSEQVWFLEDGRIYVINSMTLWEDGEFVGGLVIRVSLLPEG